MSRRSALAALTMAGAAAGVATACGPASPGAQAEPGVPRDLAERVEEFTHALTSSGPYRPTSPVERDALVPALGALAVNADDVLARQVLLAHGFTVDRAASRAGTAYVVAASDPASERSWGLFAFPVGRPVRLLAEVPHPNFDLRTEKVGLNLLADAPGAALVEAGAHRRAAGSLADVAHQTSSLFHAFVTDLAVRTRVPQVQLHGFDDEHQPGVDVVLSPGSAAVGPPLLAAGEALRADGWSVCRAWAQPCPNLEGRTNVQGIAAGHAGTTFLHVECSDGIRGERRSRVAVAAALAGAFR